MPATVRDILLMIRAKEDVQRSMSNVAGSMRRTAAAADAASARARAAALRAAAAQARITGATAAQVAALRANAKAWDDQANSISKSANRYKSLGQSAQSAGNVMQTTGIVMMAAGAATLVGLKQAVDVAADWDKQVRLTFTQVDKRYKPSLEELSDIGVRVSRDIAVPFEKVQEALFDVFSSTEANMPQAEKLLRSFSMAAVAGQTDIQTASRATIGIMNSFKIPLEDVNKVLDIQFQLVQEGVGTYEEWATKIGNVTPSAARAGQSIETMAAALATATRSGMTAARASTSVARAFDAMSHPKTEKALARIGVKTRDAKGNFRPLVEVMADWRKELEKMPKEDRVKSMIETLKGAGGTIEARRFLQNVLLTKGGLELFQDQIKEFSKDKGAFQRAYEEMANSVSSKSQLLKNSWMQVKLAIGNALLPAFGRLVDAIKKALDWFNKLPKSTQNIITQFILWGSIISIVVGAVLVLSGVLVGFAAVLAIAGTAILPILAGFVAIGAIVGVIAIGVALVGAAFFLAYQKSKPFRDLLASIGNTFTIVKNAVVAFAMGIWENFRTYVLPSLQRLWQTINQDVLPAAKKFVDWFNAELKPAVMAAVAYFNMALRPAFRDIGTVIDTQVIPALKNMVWWFQQNEYWIKPLITHMLSLIVVLGLLAGVLIGTVLKSMAMCMAWLMKLSTIFMVVSTLVGGYVRMKFNQLGETIGKIIDWFRRLFGGADSSMKGVKNTVTNTIAAIRAAFNGAGSWLINAGRDLINGLINGIRSKTGEAIQSAQNLASAVKNTVTGLFGINSPSTVFRDIGINVVRGFINGVRDSKTMKQLQTAVYRLSDAVMNSIRTADTSLAVRRQMAAKWGKKLTGTIRTLSALENKRIGLQNKLAAAQKSVNDQIKERDELAGKISEAVRKSSDITSLTDREMKTAPRMVTALKNRLTAVKEFQANLRKLAQRGFDKETIAQLAQQGVETGGAMAATLAGASQSDLNEISRIQAEIRKIAGATGTSIAGDLYNAGIKAGQGLVKGLQSQIGAITKQMNAIAAALVKQIKKELGIKSPSTVFAKIGINTARGYINGYMQHMNHNMRSLKRASVFQPDRGRVAFGARNSQAFMGTNVNRTYDQKITINTQEIDPRKNSAELGWMLEGRLP